MDYLISLTWDNDAGVWVATSDDIPGLVLEGGSFDALLERVRFAAAEILAINSPQKNACNLSFVSKRTDRIAL